MNLVEYVAEIRSYLGGRQVIGSVPKTETDFVGLIREGLPVGALISVRDRAQLSDETIYGSLRIAKRTAARRKKEAARLKPSESELVLRLARALAAAKDVLGSQQKAATWLLRENRALGGAVPITLLDTGIGFQQVMDVLKRIEHGVFS